MDRTTALKRLKEQQMASKQSQSYEHQGAGLLQEPQQASLHSAAVSHVQTDAYMDRFHEAMSSLQIRPAPDASPGQSLAAQRRLPAAREQPVRKHQGTQNAIKHLAADTQHAHAAGWRHGPVHPAGKLCELSDRPILCSAASAESGEVVLGCSDHALYVVDVQTGMKRRTLYSRACGHQEWVTCAAYCSDGRILSGGMDGALWMWQSRGSSGVAVKGHGGPISQVAAAAGGVMVSSSYDKTLRVWQARGGSLGEAGCLQGHGAPVLQLACEEGTCILASGDRSGVVMVWDLEGAGASWSASTAHKGHVTALAWLQHPQHPQQRRQGTPLLVSGGQDGRVRVWDGRMGASVASQQPHADAAGRGAVGDIVVAGCASRTWVVTAGADKTVSVLDPQASFTSHSQLPITDFPYCLRPVAGGALVAAGCGDGSLHIIDPGGGDGGGARTLYALGANAAAVRTVNALGDRLVCAGDDGKALLYEFGS